MASRSPGKGAAAPPPLAAWRLAAFASPITAVTIAFLPLVLLIPGFYAQDMGLDVGAVGGALLVARLIDAFSDPLVGSLSDRTRSRFGRRRPWIVAGVPVLMLAVWLLFLPPGKPTLLYLYACIIFVYIGWTLVFIPHQAWGAELQRGFEGRNRLNMFMALFNACGVFTCLALPFLVLSPQARPVKQVLFGWALDGDTIMPDAFVRTLEYSGAGRVPFTEIMGILAVLILFLLPLSVIACMAAVREVPVAPAPISWRSALDVLRRNKPFAHMVIGGAFLQVSVQLWTATQPFYLSVVLGLPDAFLLLLIINQAFAILTVPTWGWIARRFGRARGLALAGAAMIAGFAALFAVPYGALAPTIVAYLFLGAAADGKWMLPIALAADTADYDEWKTGRKEAGVHLSMLFLTNKLGIAAGGLALIAVGAFGFQPGRPDNSESAVLALKYITTVVPIVCSAIGMAILWRFRIGTRTHEAIRRRLARRETTANASSSAGALQAAGAAPVVAASLATQPVRSSP